MRFLSAACRAKLSDMGLSKRLVPEQISFESVGSGGSSGWQAPEQLISRSGGRARQTNSGEQPLLVMEIAFANCMLFCNFFIL